MTKILDKNSLKYLASDGKTHIVLLYSTTCEPCENTYMKFFYSQVERLTSDIPQTAISVEVINEVNEPEKAASLIKTFHLSDKQVKEGVLLIYNDNEGYIIPLSSWNSEVVNKIIHQMTTGQKEKYHQKVFIPVLAFSLGFISGLNPCLIALIMLITTTTCKRTEFLRRLSIIIYGVFYIQLVLMLIMILGVYAIYQTKLSIHIIGLILLFLGLIHIIDVISSFYGGRGVIKNISLLPPFKTPEFLKSKLKRIAYIDNPYFDFFLGNLFGLVKSPCMLAPFTLVLISGPENLLLSLILYNIGNIIPIIFILILVVIGILKSSHLSKTRLGGRIFQRGFIGMALIISALLTFIF